MGVLQAMRRMWHPKIRRQHQLEQVILEKLGRPDHILSGPFQGMKYISVAYFSSVVPKILGIYESELTGPVEAICKAQPDVIVDIGAAEGYYAVGLTKRNPQAKTICFEMYKPARALLARQAQLNAVSDRMSLRGLCDLNSLRKALETTSRPAVICDCEGAEDFLLNPDAVTKLKSAIIIVEIHDELAPGVSSRLRERFERSHGVQVIHSEKRTPLQLPRNVTLSPEEFDAATIERWTKAEWYFMVPKSPAGA